MVGSASRYAIENDNLRVGNHLLGSDLCICDYLLRYSRPYRAA